MRMFFAPNRLLSTSTLLMRFAVLVKNFKLRKSMPIPVTMIPEYSNFKILDRLSGRCQFLMHKSSQKFFLMYPALEPESCLFDENHIENPQAYVEKWKAQDNKLEIRLLEFNTVKAEFVL